MTDRFQSSFVEMLQEQSISNGAIALLLMSQCLKKWGSDEATLIEKVHAIKQGIAIAIANQQGKINSPPIPQAVIEAIHFTMGRNPQIGKCSRLFNVVATLLESGVTDESILVAAALHNNKNVTSDEILQSFGEKVWQIVTQLSDTEIGTSTQEQHTNYIAALKHCPHHIERQVLLISATNELLNGRDYLQYPFSNREKQMQLCFYGELMPMYLYTTSYYPMLHQQLIEIWAKLQQLWQTNLN
jgi:hypothetical protein